jgi:hypothetical protein
MTILAYTLTNVENVVEVVHLVVLILLLATTIQPHLAMTVLV